VPEQVHVTSELAERVREALETADLDAMRQLLAPDATWGPPDHPEWGCQNRDEVLAWFRHGRDGGGRARVIDVIAGPDTLLVGLEVTGFPRAGRDGPVERWQVMTVRHGSVKDICGFDNRAEAARRAGLS